jgi:hypothetical protein
MGKAFGILLIAAMVWVGLELYLKGPGGAFGGAFSSYLGAEAAEERVESLSTPQRAGAAVERAHRRNEARYEQMLQD